MPPRSSGRRRSTLAARISVLSVGIAVVTALIAAALAVGLIRNASGNAGRATLHRLADVAQSVTTNPATGRTPLLRLRRALNELHVPIGTVGAGGTLTSRNPLVLKAVTPSDISRVVAGQNVSAIHDVGGSAVFVEGRAAGQGGIFVVQRKADAVAQDSRAIRRLLLALLIAGVLAAAIGLLVAWRLSRPLRRTAAAAHSVAAGNRDVVLPAEGPAEVVEVSEAVASIAGALRHSEQRQRQFLLSVSHDLRTPLTAISGYAESLAEGLIPAEESARVGDVLLGEARRLERLVGDLLDLARLGAQDFRLESAPVELVGLVGSAERVWSGRCAASGVPFRTYVPAGEVWTHSDAARLRQVLDGLLENALRVTPAGAPIVLTARTDAGSAGPNSAGPNSAGPNSAGPNSAGPSAPVPVLEVRDGGPGLTDADLGIAFDQGALYERYRGVRQVGTGLGLAIVRGLVDRLGGSIEAGHADEGGARFTVRLPPSVSTPQTGSDYVPGMGPTPSAARRGW